MVSQGDRVPRPRGSRARAVRERGGGRSGRKQREGGSVVLSEAAQEETRRPVRGFGLLLE